MFLFPSFGEHVCRINADPHNGSDEDPEDEGSANEGDEDPAMLQDANAVSQVSDPASNVLTLINH